MSDFLSGAIFATALAIAAFFLRFWSQRRDRLFAFFAAAFLILALDWGALAALPVEHPLRAYLYLVRLLAFVVLLVGILDKNRG